MRMCNSAIIECVSVWQSKILSGSNRCREHQNGRVLWMRWWGQAIQRKSPSAVQCLHRETTGIRPNKYCCLMYMYPDWQRVGDTAHVHSPYTTPVLPDKQSECPKKCVIPGAESISPLCRMQWINISFLQNGCSLLINDHSDVSKIQICGNICGNNPDSI